jgi:hypothetical protein
VPESRIISVLKVEKSCWRFEGRVLDCCADWGLGLVVDLGLEVAVDLGLDVDFGRGRRKRSSQDVEDGFGVEVGVGVGEEGGSIAKPSMPI